MDEKWLGLLNGGFFRIAEIYLFCSLYHTEVVYFLLIYFDDILNRKYYEKNFRKIVQL